MSKVKAFFGYFIAALMVPIVMVTLMGMQPIAEALVKATGVVISPWITGGEVARVLPHGAYETRVYPPVFGALIGERREGFVQVVWGPTESLPETIIEDIDANADGQADFQVTLHPKTKTAEWKPYSEKAFGLQGPYQIGDGMGVRISLKQ